MGLRKFFSLQYHKNSFSTDNNVTTPNQGELHRKSRTILRSVPPPHLLNSLKSLDRVQVHQLFHIPQEGWFLVIHPRHGNQESKGPWSSGGATIPSDEALWLIEKSSWTDKTPLRHIHIPATRWQHKPSTALPSKKGALFFFTKLSPQRGVAVDCNLLVASHMGFC